LESYSVLDVKLDSVVVKDRVRKDFGNIPELADSILNNGLIEPLVLFRDMRLAAGERRLRALRVLGWSTLEHGRHYIWNDEVDPVRQQAIELEENIKRKELTWQEQALGKARLLALMQQIHGVRSGGGQSTIKREGQGDGFSIRQLSTVLGESVGNTHKDLEIAKAISLVPTLAKEETREAAYRKIKTVAIVAQMMKAAQARSLAASQPGAILGSAQAAAAQPKFKLFEGPFQDFDDNGIVPDNSVDLVYSDLPFGASLDKMSKHSALVSYSDSRVMMVSQLRELTEFAYRILKPDRFAVFWFGFNYYSELTTALKAAGFAFSPVPFVWLKNTRSTENPNVLYANSYDPALVARKGNPLFIRPGQQNSFAAPVVQSNQRLQIAEQPVALPEKFIRDMVAPGAVVADLTAGSGTTGEAVIKYGCFALLFEKEPIACTVIKARLGSL